MQRFAADGGSDVLYYEGVLFFGFAEAGKAFVRIEKQ